MTGKISRRTVIARAGTGMGALALGGPAYLGSASSTGKTVPFRYCLNTATIPRDGLDLAQQFEIAAKAGYDGVEPWLRDVQKYVDDGGSLEDLKKRLDGWGLSVQGGIGFARWSVDDVVQREAAFEQFRRDMGHLSRLGGKLIAAAPAGSNKVAGMDLGKIAERYHALLELGRETEVVPQLEIWGSSETLSRLSEAVFVAAESGHPDACLLLDVFHLYRGGSGFDGLRLLNGAAMHVFHMNDYPADPPRDTIKDSDRVYPGDGVAPMSHILRTLNEAGFRGMLSLEVFNREYWKQDPVTVARTGLEKMRKVVENAGIG
jgi:2-keto-myo-inositol isomerase